MESQHKKPQVLSRDTVLKAFFDVEKVVVKEDDKEPVTRFVVRPKAAAAILLHNTTHNTFVFGRQLRVPMLESASATNGYILEIPAGVLDEGETAEESIVREVLEETGYKMSGKAEHILYYYASPGYTSECVDLFFATLTGDEKEEEGGGLDEEGEDLEVVEIPVEDCYRMMDNGEIKDAKTLLALYWFRMKG